MKRFALTFSVPTLLYGLKGGKQLLGYSNRVHIYVVN